MSAQGSVRQPVDPRQVGIVVIAQVQPNRLATLDGYHAQTNPGIGLTGKGVVVIFLSTLTDRILALMNDTVRGDVRLVHFGKGNPLAVVRPPKAMAALHFFLGDELRQAMRFARAPCPLRQLARLTSLSRDPMEFCILDIGDPFAIRRKLCVQSRLVATVNDLP